MVVKGIGVLSLAKMMGALYAAIGFFFGLIFALMSMVGAGFANSSAEGLVGVAFGAGAVIFLPVFYGVAGFIAGALISVLYNFIAGMAGGIELQLE